MQSPNINVQPRSGGIRTPNHNPKQFVDATENGRHQESYQSGKAFESNDQFAEDKIQKMILEDTNQVHEPMPKN